jgi:hypothetical protein
LLLTLRHQSTLAKISSDSVSRADVLRLPFLTRAFLVQIEDVACTFIEKCVYDWNIQCPVG